MAKFTSGGNVGHYDKKGFPVMSCQMAFPNGWATEHARPAGPNGMCSHNWEEMFPQIVRPHAMKVLISNYQHFELRLEACW